MLLFAKLQNLLDLECDTGWTTERERQEDVTDISLVVILLGLIVGLALMLVYRNLTEVPEHLLMQISVGEYRDLSATKFWSRFERIFIVLVFKIGIGFWFYITIWNATTLSSAVTIAVSIFAALVLPWWLSAVGLLLFFIYK